MQVFIIGKTKSGKSTLANLFLDKGYVIYEAGSWARKEFEMINECSTDEFSNDFKENLTNYALSKLKEDCYYSVKQYEKFLSEKKIHKKLIVGVRNPDDFLQMLRMDSQNKVIFINSEKKYSGSLELFEEGLRIIMDYLLWREKLGNPIEVIEIKEQEVSNKEIINQLLKDKL